MVTRIYEAHVFPRVRDYDNEAEARAWVEENGQGHIVTFIRDYDGRDRSCALNKFEDGEWKGVNIHQ